VHELEADGPSEYQDQRREPRKRRALALGRIPTTATQTTPIPVQIEYALPACNLRDAKRQQREAEPRGGVPTMLCPQTSPPSLEACWLLTRSTAGGQDRTCAGESHSTFT
jgi:hypothetical protein